MPRLSRFIHCLRRLKDDRSGAFVLIFALLLLPLLGLLGLSVDYALASRAKTALDAATDAALLAAATTASEIIQAQSTPTNDPTTTAENQGAFAGQEVFLADSANARVSWPAGESPLGNLILNVSRNGLVITATGSYTALSNNIFGKIWSDTFWPVNGSATATVNIPKYTSIYMVVDISGSMGIAGTTAAQAQLASLTTTQPAPAQNCQLGCHSLEAGQSVTNEQIAESNGISLRIDAARTSVENIISSAQGDASANPRIQLGIYTLTNVVTKLSAPTTNYSSLATQAQTIDLSPFDFDNSGPGYTSPQGFNSWIASLPKSGDGSSAQTPQTWVFLMTDGVTDWHGGCGFNGNCMDVINSSDPSSLNYNQCANMTNKGIEVGVIYTTYVPIPASSFYGIKVAPIYSQIQPALQTCASSGFFYEASDNADIQKAANDLFYAATSEGRLTN